MNKSTDDFEVRACFYNEYNSVFEGYLEFRRCLEIKRKSSLQIIKNDLSVIMMNPGAGRPVNDDEINFTGFSYELLPISTDGNQEQNREITLTCDDGTKKKVDGLPLAYHDRTQEQIMKIMEEFKFNYAKVINLSDVRNARSKEFYKMLNKELKEHDHSVFSEANKDFLKGYLNPESIFVLAWGVNTKLRALSEMALKRIDSLWGANVKIVGWQQTPKNKYRYYHPLPRNSKSQKDWVTEIVRQIKEKKQML